MNNKIIKVAFCVAYDWEMLKTSIPRIYDAADIICLGIDKDRHSWACNPYPFDEVAFKNFVKHIDTKNKIDIYEDDFSLTDLNSRENGNRHRMMMANRMGAGGWHIQVDADEYFLDFNGFVQFLKNLNPNPTGKEKPYNVVANLVPLIKKVNNGYLYVDFKKLLPESVAFATTKPDYQTARKNGYFNKASPYYVIHETWARSDDDLWYKINNWGHAAEELVEKEKRVSYYKLWQSLDEFNYGYVRDFHPANAKNWPGLSFGKAKDIEDFIEHFTVPNYPLSALQLRLKNNRNMARLKALKK